MQDAVAIAKEIAVCIDAREDLDEYSMRSLIKELTRIRDKLTETLPVANFGRRKTLKGVSGNSISKSSKKYRFKPKERSKYGKAGKQQKLDKAEKRQVIHESLQKEAANVRLN